MHIRWNREGDSEEFSSCEELQNLHNYDDIYLLSCHGAGLNKLSLLPNGLKVLYCGENQLTSLPILPFGLKALYCYCNELTSLPILPSGLKELICGSNELTELPLLPLKLERLECDRSKLKQLPLLSYRRPYCNAYVNPRIVSVHNATILLRLKSGIEEFSNLTLHPDLKNAIIEEVTYYYSYF